MALTGKQKLALKLRRLLCTLTGHKLVKLGRHIYCRRCRKQLN